MAPRKQVKSLYDLAVPVVSQNLKESVDLHQENCKICDSPHHVERCPEMIEVKTYFNIPISILCSIYKKTMTGDQKTYSMFIFCWILENPELSIEFNMTKFDDRLSYVRKIDLKCELTITGFNFEFWKTVVFCASNIQVLQLCSLKAAPDIFEHIGRECIQIRKIKCYDFSTSGFTTEDFRKLIFRKFKNVEIKNECCNTLEVIHISCFSDMEDEILFEIQQIVPLLLENMPKLKRFGGNFDSSFYIRSVIESPESIFETNLKKVDLFDGTSEELLPLMKILCPILNNLMVFGGFEKGFQNLHDYFPNLEKLCVDDEENEQGEPLLRIITTNFWPKLRDVSLNSINTLDIDLSAFSKNLPEVEILEITCCNIRWNGKTYFKSLRSVKIALTDVESIFWINSFANTVRELRISTYDANVKLNKDICSAVLKVHFPILEVLGLSDLDFDFDFITKIIITFSELKRFWWDRRKTYKIPDNLNKFVNENNYQCDLE